MAKGESLEFHAKLLEDNGVVRGRIPAPLINQLGGRPGDSLIFRTDGSGSVKISLEKGKRIAAKAGKSIVKVKAAKKR
jgi:hypothetical protein